MEPIAAAVAHLGGRVSEPIVWKVNLILKEEWGTRGNIKIYELNLYFQQCLLLGSERLAPVTVSA